MNSTPEWFEFVYVVVLSGLTVYAPFMPGVRNTRVGGKALIDLKTEYEKLVESDMDESVVFDKTKKITAERLSEIRIMVRNNYQSTINAYEKDKKTVINFILDKIAESEANQLLMVEVDGVERVLGGR